MLQPQLHHKTTFLRTAMGKKTKSKSKPQRSKATKRNMEEQQEERPMFQITMADVHPNLKIRLESWAIKCNEASSFPLGVDRLRTIECFCASFVPEDVAEDEMKEYAKSLGDDDENFQSLRRELGQCWSGEGVEGVSRSEDANTIQFTLLPPSDVETDLDLVRELCFVTTDGGETWTAEG